MSGANSNEFIIESSFSYTWNLKCYDSAGEREETGKRREREREISVGQAHDMEKIPCVTQRITIRGFPNSISIRSLFTLRLANAS